MTRLITRGTAQLSSSIWRGYHTRERTLLSAGAIVAYWIFRFVGSTFGIPVLPDYQASLLLNPSPVMTIVLTVITLVACTLLCSLIAGMIHFEAGLFCAALGMLSLSTRGGPMRYVLMYAPGPAVYLTLIAELLLLAGCVGAGWNALLVLRNMGYLHGEPLREDDPDALPAQGAMALAGQVILMVFLMLLLAQTDKKAQVVWAVTLSSLLSAMAAHSLFPARPSIWFWTAPFVVGLIGYALAWMGGPPLVGGQVGGILPQLARPLPLDYASAGTAGSLLGYWVSRKWQHEHEAEPHTTGEVEEALENPVA